MEAALPPRHECRGFRAEDLMNMEHRVDALEHSLSK